ncbi:MAG: VWA domain-containing protein, partial [Acidimicrobiaceae bacterium]
AVDTATYEQQTESVTLLIDSEDTNNDDSNAAPVDEEENTLTLRFSSIETLREKDFAAYSESELREAEQIMSSLKLAGPPKRSLRLQKTNRKGSRQDIRRTMRAVLQNNGEPIERYWREPSTKLRRLVVLLDISGSMEPYARALLRFMHAAVVGRQRVEAFTLGTRLTRITRELTNRDPDRALARTSAQVADWSGGTRLGECLQNFNDNWGVGSLARGSIFVILSDGWDRGEPQVLAEQMLRLQRVAYRIIWVNPLKVSPGYAPLARGMAVAFARILRGAGVDVTLDSVIVFVSALSKVGLDNRDDVYWAAYATLIRRHEDSPIFDRAFAVFWDQLIAVDTATYEQQTE